MSAASDPTSSRQSRIPAWLLTYWPLGTGILLLVIFYWDVLFGSKALLYRDMTFVYWPTRMHFADRLLAGEFPEWYPFDGLGSSYIGNVVTAILHPSILLHLIFPHPLALSLSAVLAHFIAGAGMFFLLKSWGCGKTSCFIAALAYAASGYLVSMDGNLPYLLAASAIPWAVFFWENACQTIPATSFSTQKMPLLTVECLPYLAATAAAMACLALSGDPQALIITSLFLLGLTLFRPPQNIPAALVRLLVTACAAFLIAAPQLLPAIQSMEIRPQTAEALADNRALALHPLRLLYFFCPGIPHLPKGNVPEALFQLQNFHSFWSDSLFLGPAILALALLAIRAPETGTPQRAVRSMAALGTIALAAALGSGGNAPLYQFFQNYFPGWRFLRYPEKTIVFVTFSIAALAGLGGQRLFVNTGKEYLKNIIWSHFQYFLMFYFGLCLLLMVLFSIDSIRRVLPILTGAPLEALDELAALTPNLQSALFLGMIFSLVALLLSVPAKRGPAAAAQLIICSAAAIPLFISSLGMIRFNYRVSPQEITASSPVIQTINDIWRNIGGIGAPRIYTAEEEEVFQKIDEITSIQKAPLSPDQVLRLRTLAMTLGGGLFYIENSTGYIPLTAEGRQRIAAEKLPDQVFWNGFSVGAATATNPKMTNSDTLLRVIPNSNTAPRIRLVQGIPVPDMESALRAAQNKTFDISKEIPVETNAPDFPVTAPHNESIHIQTYLPEYIAVETYSDTASTLFIADGFARGWTAAIDDSPAGIFPGLIAGRAIGIPAGKHRIELFYRTPGLRVGLALAALGWSSIVLMFLAPGFVRRRKQPRQATV